VLLVAALQGWRARRTTRLLGAVLLVAGLASLALRFVAASVLPGLVPADIPPELGPALSAFTVRFVEPLLIYGVVVMVVGVVLLLLSFKLGSAEV
jgi:hypothetical protein